MRTPQVDPRLGMRMEISRPTKVGPEVLPQFWNPGLFGIKLAPEDFREKLKAIDEGLEITWNPHTERWQVFFRNHRINHPMCRGWQLLFVVKDPDGGYIPLDERLLAECYFRSGYKWRDGKQYFDAVMRESAREKEKADLEEENRVKDTSGEYWDYAYKPKVGYGAISASKVTGD